MSDTEKRYIPAGSCTWCGHKPHEAACVSRIRTARADAEPCPCSRRTEEIAA